MDTRPTQGANAQAAPTLTETAASIARRLRAVRLVLRNLRADAIECHDINVGDTPEPMPAATLEGRLLDIHCVIDEMENISESLFNRISGSPVNKSADRVERPMQRGA